jgi:hypothetical protein
MATFCPFFLSLFGGNYGYPALANWSVIRCFFLSFSLHPEKERKRLTLTSHLKHTRASRIVDARVFCLILQVKLGLLKNTRPVRESSSQEIG